MSGWSEDELSGMIGDSTAHVANAPLWAASFSFAPAAMSFVGTASGDGWSPDELARMLGEPVGSAAGGALPEADGWSMEELDTIVEESRGSSVSTARGMARMGCMGVGLAGMPGMVGMTAMPGIMGAMPGMMGPMPCIQGMPMMAGFGAMPGMLGHAGFVGMVGLPTTLVGRMPRSDPVSVAIGEMMDECNIAEAKLEYELKDALFKRGERWKEDLEALTGELTNARNPTALMQSKLRAMKDGTWAPGMRRGKRPETNDPLVIETRALLDKMMFKEDFEVRIVEELRKRGATWSEDLQSLERELAGARHPPGLLNAKLKDMQAGVWVPKFSRRKKEHSDDPMVIETRKLLATWCLGDLYEEHVVRELKEREATWKEDLEDLSEELKDAKNPGGYVWAKLKEMSDGKWQSKRSLLASQRKRPPPNEAAPMSMASERKKELFGSLPARGRRSRSRSKGRAAAK